MIASRLSVRRTFATSSRLAMLRTQAWISMSEGSTGTRILSALAVSAGISVASIAAGVSMTMRCVASGMRSWKARVTRLSRSKPVIRWIGACVTWRLRTQRAAEPCGSKSISVGCSPCWA